MAAVQALICALGSTLSAAPSQRSPPGDASLGAAAAGAPAASQPASNNAEVVALMVTARIDPQPS
jgi:hypothetical protein